MNRKINPAPWTPVDWVVAILTLTVCTAVIMACIVPLVWGEHLGEVQAKALASIITASVSIISMYVGAKLQRHADSKKD